MSMSTVSNGSFPVIDITHKPRRTQAGNLAQVSAMSCTEGDVVYNPNPASLTGVPKVVTIERAISFYESQAEGEYELLFKQTAKWLREYMSKSTPVSEGNKNEADV